MRKSLNINPNEIPIYAVSLAFNEAVLTGRLTEENRQWIEDRSDEFAIALATGKVIQPHPDGSNEIVEFADSELAAGRNDVLTIGGDD